MSSEVQRRPALQRVDPLEAAIPEKRPDPSPPPAGHQPAAPSKPPAQGQPGETLNAVLNTRVRPSTRARLDAAVNKLRYERNDRTISIASLTDTALDAWLRDQGV